MLTIFARIPRYRAKLFELDFDDRNWQFCSNGQLLQVGIVWKRTLNDSDLQEAMAVFIAE